MRVTSTEAIVAGIFDAVVPHPGEKLQHSRDPQSSLLFDVCISKSLKLARLNSIVRFSSNIFYLDLRRKQNPRRLFILQCRQVGLHLVNNGTIHPIFIFHTIRKIEMNKVYISQFKLSSYKWKRNGFLNQLYRLNAIEINVGTYSNNFRPQSDLILIQI